MKWLTLFLQLISLRKNFLDSQALMESAHAVAARGKRYAVSFALLAVSGLFLFSAFLLAVIELGLQIDRGQLAYSGLMVSSTLLLGISALFAFLSFLLSRSDAPPPPPPPPPNPLKDLLEEFLVSFLSRLKTKPPSGTEP